MAQTKYVVVETTDMRNGGKSYKIYERSTGEIKPPVLTGLVTREEAEAKLRELEAAQ